MQIKPKNSLHHQKTHILMLFFGFVVTTLLSFSLMPGQAQAAPLTSQPCAQFTGEYKTRCQAQVKACGEGQNSSTLKDRRECIGTAVGKIYATTPEAICDLKVNKTDCLKDAEACGADQNCINKLKFRKPVLKICNAEDNPQKCHETIIKALAKCAEGPGGAVRESCEVGARLAGTVEAPKGVSQDDKVSLAAKGEKNYQCGNTKDKVMTQINLGCQGEKLKEPTGPIQDMLYAFIRFLSYGVGLIMAASIIYAGLQYTASEGNAEASQASKTRIKNALVGLIFYIMIWSFIQYLVPGGLFK